VKGKRANSSPLIFKTEPGKARGWADHKGGLLYSAGRGRCVGWGSRQERRMASGGVYKNALCEEEKEVSPAM